jgi:hypothetical protein
MTQVKKQMPEERYNRKKMPFIIRLGVNTIVLFILSLFNLAQINYYEGWFLDYGQNAHNVAIGNFIENITPWFFAYLSSLLFFLLIPELNRHFRVRLVIQVIFYLLWGYIIVYIQNDITLNG